MFKDKLIIIPSNMKLINFFSKIAPRKVILAINSNIQRRKIYK